MSEITWVGCECGWEKEREGRKREGREREKSERKREMQNIIKRNDRCLGTF